jgi:hypothetical protein
MSSSTKLGDADMPFFGWRRSGVEGAEFDRRAADHSARQGRMR